MRENSKMVDAIHELKPKIDVLMLIGQLAQGAAGQELVPAARVWPGLSQVILDTIMAFEKCYRYVGDIDFCLRCYEGSYHAACDHQDQDPVVCHSWIRHFDTGRYVHAWVQVGNNIFDYTVSREPIDKEYFYRTNGIEGKVVRYGFVEFLRLCVESGGYGPFDESFKN